MVLLSDLPPLCNFALASCTALSAALADADPGDVESLIHSTGFYRNKAKNIRGAAKKIIEDFGGKVPATMDELLTIPGAGRKTANVVLGEIWNKPEGVVVDAFSAGECLRALAALS